MGGRTGRGRGPGGGGSGGGGGFGRRGLAIVAAVLVGIWLLMSFYTVRPEEQSVELTFGECRGDCIGEPGLNFAPWPIVTHEVVQVTRENTEEIGSGTVRGTSAGLMLTGDENIVDISFQVVWNVRDPAEFLFNLSDPTSTIQAVAESAMRGVVSRSQLSPILNRDRGLISQEVKDLIQQTLDEYGSGVNIVRVNFDKADPPQQVIDAFREVQAARQERSTLQNQADAYANKTLAGARGNSAQTLQEAEGYRARVVNAAQGEASRFTAVQQEYVKAPEVTRKRLYLETMQDVLGSVRMFVLDTPTGNASGIVPYLPLNELKPDAVHAGRRGSDAPPADPHRRSSSPSASCCSTRSIPSTSARRRWCCSSARCATSRSSPGLAFKVPFIQNVVFYDSRIQGLDTNALEVTPLDDRRLIVDAFARWRISDVSQFRRAVGVGGMQAATQRLEAILNANVREALGSVRSEAVLSADRVGLMNRIRDQAIIEARDLGIEIIDVRLKRADLPEQNLAATFDRMKAEREREAADERARGNEAAQRLRAQADRTAIELVSEAERDAQVIRGESDAERNRILAEAYGADPEFFAFMRSMDAYRGSLKADNATMLVEPDSAFFDYLHSPEPRAAGTPPAAAPAAPAPAASAGAEPNG